MCNKDSFVYFIHYQYKKSSEFTFDFLKNQMLNILKYDILHEKTL